LKFCSNLGYAIIWIRMAAPAGDGHSYFAKL